MTARAVIFGPAGAALSGDEARFFREADPWGFILFARNVADPAQLRRLTDGLREAVGRDAPVLVDQEGGRVQRLGPPHWRRWGPVMGLFDGSDEARALEATRLRYRIIADELRQVGIDVDCVPLLDIPVPEGDAVIGRRALGQAADEVARRGRAVCEGLLDGGVLPVVKHMPGHGRAEVDSHFVLPRVSAPLDELERIDFAPFRALCDQALGMTAHIVYDAIDPDRPATVSPAAILAIRDRIGFDGLLMTDDLSMQALSGRVEARATDALAAGCDVILHCNGDMTEMAAVASAIPRLSGPAEKRALRAEAARRTPVPVDIAEVAARYEALTGEALHG